MGCDIHMFTEVKVNGTWYTYGHPNTPRSYAFFDLLAGVRGPHEGIEPIAEPRGLPKDISLVAGLAAKAYGDGHSHSYITSDEMGTFESRWVAYVNTIPLQEGERRAHLVWGLDIEDHYLGYLELNTWAGFAMFRCERTRWFEDVRWVFWFDN